MTTPSTTDPVANPTWYADIRSLFTSDDISHMQAQALDLTSYTEVINHSADIYAQTAVGNMPLDYAGNPAPWPAAWVTTFLNWMNNGYPIGTPATSLLAAKAVVSSAPRIRKEIRDLSTDEVTNLTNAFLGIMKLDSTKSLYSYFVQAGYHWLPAPNTYCLHHIPGYNPWHRAYLLSFENALRSIEGCGDVTLPYWDITKWDEDNNGNKVLPSMLNQSPFNSYTLPEDIGNDGDTSYSKGYTTFRDTDANIYQALTTNGVPGDIVYALGQTGWEDFHGVWNDEANSSAIIAAHDGGHLSVGGLSTKPVGGASKPVAGTMSYQSVAAFDPIFWFFHANWDRLFWKWQKQMDATTLNGLLTTINKDKDLISYQTFTDSALVNDLPPFTDTTVSIIDSVNSLGVDYQDSLQTGPTTTSFLPKMRSTLAASQKFSVQTSHVNVRVDGLNRLKIPGSFSVHLLKDGQRIASKAFFQPNEVAKCENCVENAIVHFDFRLPLDVVSNGKLEVVVEPVDKSFVGSRFPHKLMGNPTIKVQLLMQTE